MFLFMISGKTSGWVKLTSAAAGTEVKLRFSELLHSDGMINVIPMNC